MVLFKETFDVLFLVFEYVFLLLFLEGSVVIWIKWNVQSKGGCLTKFQAIGMSILLLNSIGRLFLDVLGNNREITLQTFLTGFPLIHFFIIPHEFCYLNLIHMLKFWINNELTHVFFHTTIESDVIWRNVLYRFGFVGGQ